MIFKKGDKVLLIGEGRKAIIPAEFDSHFQTGIASFRVSDGRLTLWPLDKVEKDEIQEASPEGRVIIAS